MLLLSLQKREVWPSIKIASQPLSIPVKREKSNPWNSVVPTSPIEMDNVEEGMAASPPLTSPLTSPMETAPPAASPPDSAGIFGSPTYTGPLLGLRDIMEQEQKLHQSNAKASGYACHNQIQKF